MGYPIARIYWFITRPKSYGVKCVIYYRNEVLMIRQSYGGNRWAFPGGSIKKGETPEQAVKREVKEEVGINLENVVHLGEFKTTIEYKLDTVYCFSGIVNNRVFVVDNNEVVEANWFPMDNLPPLSFISEKVISLI